MRNIGFDLYCRNCDVGLWIQVGISHGGHLWGLIYILKRQISPQRCSSTRECWPKFGGLYYWTFSLKLTFYLELIPYRMAFFTLCGKGLKQDSFRGILTGASTNRQLQDRFFRLFSVKSANDVRFIEKIYLFC